MPAISKLAAATTSLMITARTSVSQTRVSAKAVAEMVLSAADSDKAAKEFFLTCRADYATAKGKKDATTMKVESAAYNQAVSAVRYHLREAGWTISMPNFRTGLGDAVLMTVKDANQAAKDKAAAEAEADAEARAKRGPAAEAEVSMERIREMGPQDVADQIVQILTVWSDKDADHKAVLKVLTAVIDPPKPRAPRKPKAVVEVTETA
jgi:hypothetical protein